MDKNTLATDKMTLPIHHSSLYVPLTFLTALLNSLVTQTASSATRSAEIGRPCFLPQFEYSRHVSSSQHNLYDRPPPQTQHPPQHYAYAFDCPRHDFYQHNAYDNPPQQAQALPQHKAYNLPPQPAQPGVNFVNDSWQPYSQQDPEDPTLRHTIQQGHGSWEPYGAQFTYDRPLLTSQDSLNQDEALFPCRTVTQGCGSSLNTPCAGPISHDEPQYAQSPVESTLGYFSVLKDYSDPVDGSEVPLDEHDTTTKESTEPTVDIAEISQEVAEDFMLKMATARSEIVGEEIVERTALWLLQVLVDESEVRHAVLWKELFRSHQVLSQFTQRLEAVCRKQLQQLLQHAAQLHKELADKPLMRRQLENECTQERKRRIGPNTPMSYKNRVYTWLTKRISKGQRRDEWLKYCGKHVDPFRHSENSLLAYLRHQGTVRGSAVFHHLRAPPWENVALQKTSLPPPHVPNHKDILQAIEQSESALIVDLVGSSRTSASPPGRPSSALSLVGPERRRCPHPPEGSSRFLRGVVADNLP